MAININAVHLLHPTEKKNGCPTMHRHYSCNNSHFITWVMVWNSLAIKARERKQERGKKSQREITESKKERRQGRAGRGRRRNRGKQKKKTKKKPGKDWRSKRKRNREKHWPANARTPASSLVAPLP